MSTQIEAVVIGGGAIGLSVGYHLLIKGVSTIVLEGSYLNSGATGRGLGVLKARIPHAMEDGNEDLVKLAGEGLELHEGLSSEMGINTFFRKSGCLIVARDENDIEQLRRYHQHFQKLGLKEVELSPSDIERKWPYMDAREILMGFYAPDEANVHPYGIVWAYVENIRALDGRVEKNNKVKTVKETSNGFKVLSEKGEYLTDNLVIACASYSSEIMQMLNFELPIIPMRKEVIISEPMRPFFGPTIERLSKYYRITQTMRGEIMGTIGWMEPGFDLDETSTEFPKRYAEETVAIIPSLKYLRVIRQWTGICDKTPDEKPLIGALDDGLYISCGFYDYGITMVPVVGRLLAETIATGTTGHQLRPFDPHRFY